MTKLMPEIKVKTITYKPNGNKPDEDTSGFDPLYGGEDETKKREGIMSQLAQMSNRELREFYGGYLVPYGYKEDQIMRMPIKELELLFNKVMRI